MTKQELEKFVRKFMKNFFTKKSYKERLAFWKSDSRSKLMGEWYCPERPNMEIDIKVRDNYFVIEIFDNLRSNQEITMECYPLHNGETDRLFYFIRKGMIEELVFDGDFDGEGDEEGPYLEWGDLAFYLAEGTRKWFKDVQQHADEDEIGINGNRNSSQFNI